jgi:hypothetical protein
MVTMFYRKRIGMSSTPLLLALTLLSCAPHYVPQPATQPDPAITVIAVEPSPGYWAAERRYEAWELCVVMTHARASIMVAAGAAAQDTIALARDLCWLPGATTPFERLLADGLKSQLERAAEEAERAMKGQKP